ncbi:MAG: DUF2179 domain-containing protein [Spirochaetes bacterium]|nr:DUF2179 domain-containing protein [Spirochaetota bacterium]
MFTHEFFTTDIFRWVLLPLLIFLARVCDVTIGTLRIIFVSRGNKLVAPLLAFFELLIWIFAVGQIMHNISNVACYFAFAGGFAFGTYIGIVIEEKLAIGIVLTRTITKSSAKKLITVLRKKGYGSTSIEARGSTGKVSVIYTILNRTHLDKIIGLIKLYNPEASYSVEDVRHVSRGIFPDREPFLKSKFALFFKHLRKGKL